MRNAAIHAGTGLLCLSACTTNVFTPPAHIAEHQSPKVLEKGFTTLVLSGGGNSGTFQTALLQGGVLVRRGMGDGWDASAGVNATWFDKQGVDADYSPWMWAVHAGTKWNPAGQGEFALTGSLGAGHAAGGEFASAETGILMGIENGFLVPYLGGSIMANLPFATRPLILKDMHGDPVQDEAEFTTGFRGFLGFKLPLARVFRVPASPQVMIEGHYAWLHDDDEDNGFYGAFLGLEIPFHR